MKGPLIFFGSGGYSLTVLKVLQARNTTPTAVVTYPGSPVYKWATERQLQTLTPATLIEPNFIDAIRTYNADLFVVAGFSKLPQELFELPHQATVNIHPSLLPAFRGSEPEIAQIYTDAHHTGVTIHIIDNTIDHGPIIAQAVYNPPIWPMSAARLSFELGHLGANLLVDKIQTDLPLTSGHAQNESGASYTKQILREQTGVLNHEQDHTVLWRTFCAFGWNGNAYLQLTNTDTNQEVTVTSAYMRNGFFVIRTVSIDGVSCTYDEFLSHYQLLMQKKWTQFSTSHNVKITTSQKDSQSSNPVIRLREMIQQRVVVFGDTHTIVESGVSRPHSWLLDFRNIFLDSTALETIADIFWSKYKDQYPFQVGGQETAAIPLIAAIVIQGGRRGTPVNGFYLRKERKKNGLQKNVEGEVTDHPIILVDDLINSGKTQEQQLSILHNLGKTVTGIFTIVRFRENRHYRFASENNINIHSLFTPTDFGLAAHSSKSDKPPQVSNFKMVWKFNSDNPNLFYVVPKSRPVLDHDNLYFGADNGTFWALDQATGAVVWKHHIWRTAAGKAIFSSPILHKGMVIYGAYDGNVYARHAKDGTKKWTFNEADWVGSSPCVAARLGLVFIGLEFGLFKHRGGIAALDSETGRKKWEFAMDGLTHASPAYESKYNAVGIGCNNHMFYLLDAKSGTLRWQFETKGDIKYTPAFDTKHNRVLFGSFDGNLYACAVDSGEVVATFATAGEIYSTPKVYQDSVFVTSMDKCIYCLDRRTLEKIWHFETYGKILSSPEIINDRVYVGSNDGFLYELGLDGKPTGFFHTGERMVNNVVYNKRNDSFYAPTFANEIYKLKRLQ
jgi:outer membrane protein assembly factor BamB/methionyl-tRNA formyltransferase/adenine/guanine phosphoribosyltransferase-like PRPP-binding protein